MRQLLFLSTFNLCNHSTLFNHHHTQTTWVLLHSSYTSTSVSVGILLSILSHIHNYLPNFSVKHDLFQYRIIISKFRLIFTTIGSIHLTRTIRPAPPAPFGAFFNAIPNLFGRGDPIQPPPPPPPPPPYYQPPPDRFRPMNPAEVNQRLDDLERVRNDVDQAHVQRRMRLLQLQQENLAQQRQLLQEDRPQLDNQQRHVDQRMRDLQELHAVRERAMLDRPRLRRGQR
jgi:hypothetical protein